MTIRRKRKVNRGVLIQVRVTEREKEAFRQAAKKQRLGLSAFIRPPRAERPGSKVRRQRRRHPRLLRPCFPSYSSKPSTHSWPT
jgi:hypothetical protein